MFYATKIKEVSGGKAIDEQGKVLSFIGYLPVEVNDTVFTDGTVIFGNAKVKGGHNFSGEIASGIPVISEKMKGYFKPNGNYKKTYIAGKKWLVNAKKTYSHDTDEKEIIDAEIAHDNSGKENGVFTVEKKLYGSTGQYDYALLEDETARDCELIIRKDTEEKERVRLSTLSKPIEELALTYVKIVEVARQKPVDKVTTSATITNFKIMPDGSWQMLVDYSIVAIRQFTRINASINFNSTRAETYNEGTFPENFPWGGDRAAIAAAFRAMGFTEVTTDIVLRDSDLAQSFFKVFYDLMRPSYTEELIEYGTTASIEISEEDTGKYYDTTARCSFLICFYSDGTFKKVYEEAYCTPLIMDVTNYEGVANGEAIPNSLHVDATKDKTTYPYITYRGSYKIITGGYHWVFTIWTFRGVAIKDRFNEDTRDYCNITCTAYRYDSRNLPNAPPYNQYFYSADDNFSFPIQDGYFVQLKPSYYYMQKYNCFFGSIYDKAGNTVINNIFPTCKNAHEWHISIVPLKDGSFLFGVHDYCLYKVTNTGVFTQIDSGLKNFRLRELQNIKSAKK